MTANQLDKIKIMPVLVLNDLDEGLKICEALCANGLPAAEITFRTAAAEPVIREAVKRFPEMYIGAGTVLNVADLHRAVDAGAKFGVAPGFNPVIVEEANKTMGVMRTICAMTMISTVNSSFMCRKGPTPEKSI